MTIYINSEERLTDCHVVHGCNLHGIMLVGFQTAIRQGPGLPSLPNHAIFHRFMYTIEPDGGEAEREDDTGSSNTRSIPYHTVWFRRI